MKKLLFYGHDGFYNRGCEAIVRTSAPMLAQMPGTKSVTLASKHPMEDGRVSIPGLNGVIPHHNRRGTIPWAVSGLGRRLGQNAAANRAAAEWMRSVAKVYDVFFCIGGDTYCYDEPLYLYALNRVIRSVGKPTVLWGASIDPALMTPRMLRDLSAFSRIVVREPLSFEALRERGLQRVSYAPDPAFTLKAEPFALPKGFVPGQTVGINVSPLALGYAKDPDTALRAVTALVARLLGRGMPVALIPHVFDPRPGLQMGDLTALREIAARLRSVDSLILMEEPLSAPQLKWLIGQCRVLVAARTHALIAAYGSGVPALALGYSVKAQGIARLVYGGDPLHTLLPVSGLRDRGSLYAAFDAFMGREDTLRAHLRRVIPRITAEAEEAARYVSDLIAGRA